MGGMPMGGMGAPKGGGAGDSQRKSTGIVPKAALWGDPPGQASVLYAPSEQPEAADQPPTQPDTPQPDTPQPPAHPQPTPVPPAAAPPPTPLAPSAPVHVAPPPGSNVQIRIEMAD